MLIIQTLPLNFRKKNEITYICSAGNRTTLNMGGKFTEQEYISWVIKGCLAAGIYPMVGDTAVDSFLLTNLEELKGRWKWNCNNKALENPEVIKR